VVVGTYVIGDIHGCPDELTRLVDKLPLNSSDRLIFLGDYVDRGPDSKGVISYLIELQRTCPATVVFLK
jgi:Calcineurin-like phosphoesterase